MRYNTLTKGNSYNLNVSVTTTDEFTGEVIPKDIGEVTEITYYIARSAESDVAIVKKLSDGDIVKTIPSEGKFTIELGKDDLLDLPARQYYHECVLLDINGFQAVVISESVQIKESIIL